MAGGSAAGRSRLVTDTMRPSRITTSAAAPSRARSLSNTRALRISVVPWMGLPRRLAMSTSSSPSACTCRASSAAALPCQPSSINCIQPGEIDANRRGTLSVVAQTKRGVRPTPVSASNCTARLSLSRVTSASATLRMLRVPLGSSGNLPSARLASAASTTDVSS